MFTEDGWPWSWRTGGIGDSAYRALWVNLLLVPSWFVLQIDGHQLDPVLQALGRKNEARSFFCDKFSIVHKEQ
jgi:hypothetical protein